MSWFRIKIDIDAVLLVVQHDFCGIRNSKKKNPRFPRANLRGKKKIRLSSLKKMVAAGYTYQLAFVCSLLLIIWTLYIIQAITFRFTPRRRLVKLKVVMLGFASVALVCSSVRAPDPSGVFGRISLPLTGQLSVQSTAAQFFVAASWLTVSTRALYVHISYPMPRWIAPGLFLSVILFQLCNTITTIVQMHMVRHPNDYDSFAPMRMQLLMDVVLDVEVMFLLSTCIYLWYSLRGKIAAFLMRLEQQEATRLERRQQVSQAAATPALFVRVRSHSRATSLPGIVVAATQVAVHARRQSMPRSTANTYACTSSSSSAVSSSSSDSSSHVPPPPTVTIVVVTPDRLVYLNVAMTKITRITVVACLVSMGTIASTYSRILLAARGGIDRDTLYGKDPDSFALAGSLGITLQLLCLLAVVYYVWSSPAIWFRFKQRHDRHTPFWLTLWRGHHHQQQQEKIR